jgi:hypothetical protein
MTIVAEAAASYLAKYSESKRSQLSKEHGVLWEVDQEIKQCRFCLSVFTFWNRRHHCRSCGGIFCNKCCYGDKLQCTYCLYGLSPSKALLTTYKSISQYSSLTNHRFLNQEFFVSQQPKLEYGSLYDDNFVRPLGEIAHRSGYFQITNRSTQLRCCAVKLLTEGCNLYHEIFRPPYYPLPPRESLTSHVTNCPFLYLIVLFDNPHPTYEGMTVVYQRKRLVAGDISPCTSPKWFRRFLVYKIDCRGKNVLVKFTDEDKVEPRDGQGRRIKKKAVGMFTDLFRTMSSSSLSSSSSTSSLTSLLTVDHRLEAATLDYETNIKELEIVVQT